MRRSLLLVTVLYCGAVQAQEVPVARDDFFNTVADSTITITAPGVLENDSADVAIEAVLVTPPANGTLSLADDGSFLYTPTPGFSGTDTFTYTARTKDVPEQFVVDPSRSGTRLTAVLTTESLGSRTDNDTSAVSGTIVAEVIPNTSPFSEIQVREMNLVLSDALSLTFDFTIIGSIDVTTDSDSLTLSLSAPGTPAVVVGGSFAQIGNNLNMAGTLNVAASGLLANAVDSGPQTLDATVPSDISGAIVEDTGQLELAFPLDATGSFDVGTNTVAVTMQGAVVAGGPVVIPKTSNLALVAIVVAPVGTGTEDVIAERFYLAPAYPNPVRGEATVAFELPEAADVSLIVFDALGREVENLASGFRSAGSHRVRLDASFLSAGLYLCRLQAGSRSATIPLSVVR